MELLTLRPLVGGDPSSRMAALNGSRRDQTGAARYTQARMYCIDRRARCAAGVNPLNEAEESRELAAGA